MYFVTGSNNVLIHQNPPSSKDKTRVGLTTQKKCQSWLSVKSAYFTSYHFYPVITSRVWSSKMRLAYRPGRRRGRKWQTLELLTIFHHYRSSTIFCRPLMPRRRLHTNSDLIKNVSPGVKPTEFSVMPVEPIWNYLVPVQPCMAMSTMQLSVTFRLDRVLWCEIKEKRSGASSSFFFCFEGLTELCLIVFCWK